MARVTHVPPKAMETTPSFPSMLTAPHCFLSPHLPGSQVLNGNHIDHFTPHEGTVDTNTKTWQCN